MSKITREKFKTFENVFDNFTINILTEFAKRRIFLEGTISPVKIGKEANVFSCENEQGKKLCLKIYRLETANFNRMYEYIRSDSRFIGVLHKKRKVIFAWVQREYRNLILAKRAGVPVPEALKFQMNVLLMEFIGGKIAAPMLKDAPPRNPSRFYAEVIKAMKTLKDAGFAHGDLSHFNILNRRERPVLIDFSHATTALNPIYKELMARDAKNIASYFRGLGVETSEQRILEELKK